MKTQTRLIAEQIKSITGESLVVINLRANSYVEMGLVESQLEALKYCLELVKYI